jgi:putative ABC transport system ATP-binding protein
MALRREELQTNVIRASGLTKQVAAPAGVLHILQGVDLEVNASDAVSILGTSGAGKSTLLGLLAGLDTASSGEVSLFGRGLSRLDEDGRAALRAGRVGFVFQAFHLIAGMTALENVALPLSLAGRGTDPREALALLEAVGLDARAGHYPNQLSGGEQQRVAIARAFAGSPDLLFADEPTGNLDAETGHHVADVLFNLRDEHGTALVLVTHDPELATRCDRRYRLSAGRLEALQ